MVVDELDLSRSDAVQEDGDPYLTHKKLTEAMDGQYCGTSAFY